MGFYLRKSISVGPFRFNLSQHGVGVSAGIKGLRIGTSPRGNYVHMGRGGLYYRATLPATPRVRQPRPAVPGSMDPPIPAGTHAALEDIESADASTIVDSSSRELLEEMNAKQQKARLWPTTAIGTGALTVLGLLGSWPIGVTGAALGLGLALTYAASMRDALAKTVVLFYHFDSEMERAYAQLHASAEKMAKVAAVWHIEAQGAVHDPKYHAGASSLVRRKATTVARASPPYVKTNIETVAVAVGRQTLHFFPDRVLVYDASSVGAVGYRELRLAVQSARFIEDGTPPHDATVVDRTWRYVNKSGGPDRRFSNNTELPICLYDEVALSSTSGLNEVVQLSRNGVAADFVSAVAALARVMPVEPRNS
ncbi:DUF4236 domain-containing protein [Cognatilysobacter tabacisoli]|uniref:DUF4236 domain-containing protein n=1 Tax=Cognatilysobacter tabacisoli TaxID=2315424 RepID=UPI000E6B018A|nr:DUF4236 domain-containing protein [Lysobacter tabacisoli]